MALRERALSFCNEQRTGFCLRKLYSMGIAAEEEEVEIDAGVFIAHRLQSVLYTHWHFETERERELKFEVGRKDYGKNRGGKQA